MNGKLFVTAGILFPQENEPSGTDSAVYADEEDGAVYARSDGGTAVQLTSHFDPRRVDPNADSSFADENVVLPYSIHHYNRLTGKGAVIDLTALVADMEQLQGKSYTYVYDVTDERILDVEDWRSERLESRERTAKNRVIEESPEIEIGMADAWENVEVSERVARSEQQTRYEYDLETETVTPVQEEVEVTDSVGTGTFERRLKEGVRFDEMTGKFYLTQTLENVQVDPPATPEPPQWIQDRLPVAAP